MGLYRVLRRLLLCASIVIIVVIFVKVYETSGYMRHHFLEATTNNISKLDATIEGFYFGTEDRYEVSNKIVNLGVEESLVVNVTTVDTTQAANGGLADMEESLHLGVSEKTVVQILSTDAAVSQSCSVPPGGFKAWKKGVVSTVTPHVAINCSKVFSKDKAETDRIKKVMSMWKDSDNVTEQVRNCSWLRESFASNLYNSELEESFPIAFTFVVYDSPQQVLRLLRLLYRPQNTYCIHPDMKSKYKEFFYTVASCFDNVIIPSKLEDVVWGYYTILAAQMNCMKDLLEYRKSTQHKWRYVINLCGKELPLVSNRAIVSKLMKLNGTSSIVPEYCGNDKYMLRRIKYPAKVNAAHTLQLDKHVFLKNRPFNLSLYHKSSSYNAISYQFGNYLVNNSTAQKFYAYFKKCSNPEEHYYATLFMMPGVPGGYNKSIPVSDYFRVAGAFWVFKKRKDCECHGQIIHAVCIITAADLAYAVTMKKSELFINKYFYGLDHTVMSCMEERIVEQNQLEYQKDCGAIDIVSD